jgi:hypothetical protein
VLGCYCWTSSLRKARHSRPFGLALELFPEIGPHLGQPAGTTLVVVEEAPKRALVICDRRVEVRNGVVHGTGAR